MATKKIKKVNKIPRIGFGSEEPVKKSGLNKIDDIEYNLIKISSKVPSSFGYPDNFTAITRARFFIVSNLDLAWIVGENVIGAWFKTSPVLSVKKKTNNYILETENSFYKLERCEETKRKAKI